ncbi:MAG: inositol-3-phosphate synthase, partial [Candidatus Krumholzibacteria bacterium]|nr:inositol-3-phosphate synthase [Candidatus Krumholzibacteria bacterium]
MEITKKLTKPKGKLGILTPGMGAVATTFYAGVEAVRRGHAKPFGSLTQMGTIRLGKRTDNRTPLIKDFVPLAGMDDLVFGGWDIFEDNAYEAAKHAGVLEPALVEKVRPFLEGIKPMKAVFDQNYVKRLSGTWVKKGKTWYDHAEQLKEDILAFKEREKCDRLVMVWCASTEIFLKPTEAHRDIESFEKALKARSAEIAPSMVYAYAALSLGIPFANGAPNLTV